jgi:hypothetical protein
MMKAPTLRQATFAAKLTWFLVKAPFVLFYKLSRVTRKIIGGWILKTSDSFLCSGCGDEISLVGRWECGWCGYVFDGFFFARCAVCGAVPPYVKCQACGVGIKNPTN